jgi:hypothetical protein
MKPSGNRIVMDHTRITTKPGLFRSAQADSSAPAGGFPDSRSLSERRFSVMVTVGLSLSSPAVEEPDDVLWVVPFAVGAVGAAGAACLGLISFSVTFTITEGLGFSASTFDEALVVSFFAVGSDLEGFVSTSDVKIGVGTSFAGVGWGLDGVDLEPGESGEAGVFGLGLNMPATAGTKPFLIVLLMAVKS